MKLQKFTALLSTLFLLSIFSLSVSAQESPRVVRVGIYDNKPKVYQDQDGTVKGFFADIVNYVAEQENWNVEYVYGTWAEGLSRLENGEIDTMVDVALSEEQREKYDFNNETVLINWATVYTREGFEIQSLQDLEGKDIAVMKGGIHYDGPMGIKVLLESFGINANFIEVDLYADVFELLDKKEADAGVVNRVFGVANEPDYDVIRSNVVFNPIELRFAFTKDDSDNSLLISAFDKQLREMKSDPDSVYYESIRTYLPGFTVRVQQETPLWIIITMISLAFVLACLIIIVILNQFYQRRLEIRVKDRTEELNKSTEKYQRLYEKSQQEIQEMEILMKAAVNRELKIKELKKRLSDFE